MVKTKKKSKIILSIVLVFSLVGTACEKDKARALAKAANDCAEAQKSIVTVIQAARDLGELNEEEVAVLKKALLTVNTGNDKLIQQIKKWISEPSPETELDVSKAIQQLTTAVLQLNTAGLLRIKNPEKRIAFSGFIIAIQGAIASAILVINSANKKG